MFVTHILSGLLNPGFNFVCHKKKIFGERALAVSICLVCQVAVASQLTMFYYYLPMMKSGQLSRSVFGCKEGSSKQLREETGLNKGT